MNVNRNHHTMTRADAIEDMAAECVKTAAGDPSYKGGFGFRAHIRDDLIISEEDVTALAAEHGLEVKAETMNGRLWWMYRKSA